MEYHIYLPHLHLHAVTEDVKGNFAVLWHNLFQAVQTFDVMTGNRHFKSTDTTLFILWTTGMKWTLVPYCH